VWQFKQEEVGEASLWYPARSERPVAATDESHQEWRIDLKKIIESYRKTLVLNWESKEGVGHSINLLGFQKVCAR
jgi:hypothetical protein